MEIGHLESSNAKLYQDYKFALTMKSQREKNVGKDIAKLNRKAAIARV